MKAKTASRTAQYMAMFRAIESTRLSHDRLFNDPFATLFLDKTLYYATALSRYPFLRNILYQLIERKGPGAFSSGIARTRLIDDLLERSILQDQVQQVIMLGAGFDTRAVRLESLKKLPVIEIDHPDTAALKMEKLRKRFGKLPEHITFLQIDFNQQSLNDLAREHNLDLTLRTAIVWEGVTNYISGTAVENTFSFLSLFAKNSSVIFTYIDKLVLDRPDEFYGTKAVLKTLRENEEEWTFGIYPKELPGFLNRFQYELVEDRSAVEYRNTYMPGRKNLLKGYEFYRVAFALRR